MSKSLYPKSYQLIYPFKKWNGWGPNQTYCTNQRCLNLHQKNIDELLYIHPIGQAPPSTDLHCKTTKAMQSTNEHISTDEIWWLEATVSQKNYHSGCGFGLIFDNQQNTTDSQRFWLQRWKQNNLVVMGVHTLGSIWCNNSLRAATNVAM